MFDFILRHCTKLESIEVTGHSKKTISPENLQFFRVIRNEVREKFYSVRHFHTNYTLKEEIFNSLLASTPNPTSLRLRPNLCSDTPVILSCMFRSTHMFTKLDPHFTLSSKEMLTLVRAYSSSLLELKVRPKIERKSPSVSPLPALGDCT